MTDPKPNTGPNFPFKLVKRGKKYKGFAWASGEEKIRQSIIMILFTNKGERLMRPDFGSDLRRLVFEPMSQTTLSLAKYYIEEALLSWEPRIDLVNVDVRTENESGRLVIQIDYKIKGADEPQLLEVPFSLR